MAVSEWRTEITTVVVVRDYAYLWLSPVPEYSTLER